MYVFLCVVVAVAVCIIMRNFYDIFVLSLLICDTPRENNACVIFPVIPIIKASEKQTN